MSVYEEFNLDRFDIKAFKEKIYDEITNIVKVAQSSLDFHSRLQNYLFNLAEEYEKIGVKEFYIPNFYADRNGSIDVVWLTQDRDNYLSIEIDSSPRRKSLKKLLSSNARFKVWIIYTNNISKLASVLKEHDPESDVIVLYFKNVKQELRDRLLRQKEHINL